MAGLCKAMIIGRLGRDPEVRYTPSGKPITSFRVACSRAYTTADGERKEETEWFGVSAAGRIGEICAQYLAKGRLVFVEGRLQSRTWVGSDGQKGFAMDIFASDVQLLDPKPKADTTDLAADDNASAGSEDQIPF